MLAPQHKLEKEPFLSTPPMFQGLPNTWLNLKGKGQGEGTPMFSPRAPPPPQPLGAWVLPDPLPH